MLRPGGVFFHPHQMEGNGSVVVRGIHRRHEPQIRGIKGDQRGDGIRFAHNGRQLDQRIGGEIIYIIPARTAAVALEREEAAIGFSAVSRNKKGGVLGKEIRQLFSQGFGETDQLAGLGIEKQAAAVFVARHGLGI